ncbi:MAG: hypothetical protein HYW50_03935, partial [Candidatus Diapherotrites archaeon]|nr:hypothetical protein [Candidatus Diapherotrites archaeon]
MLSKKIHSIDFYVLSPEQIRKMSALEIKTPETYDKDGFPMESGLMDPHLGVINPGIRCKTCGQKMKQCPGHFGNLELVRPVVHPEFSKRLEVLMHATCRACGRLKLLEEKIEHLRQNTENDIESIQKKIVLRAKKVKKCPHCKSPDMGELLLDKPTNFFFNKERIYPTEIREWIEKISTKDLELFGYDVTKLKPEWFILTALQVPPITIRPSITLETGIKSEDDLTHKLVDIIRINMRLKDNIEAGAPQLIIEDLWDLLQYHVTTYFNNNTAGVPPAKHRSGRALRTIVQRLQGKKGRFRYNLTGTRVNYAARSIITPDSQLSINELGVPEAVAKEMTVPEPVTEFNIEKIKKIVQENRAVYLIRPNGSRKKITDQNKEEVLSEIEPGSKIERLLSDGDFVLFNRQPSLHRLSMLCHKAKILPGKTFRLNAIVCVDGKTNVLLESGLQDRISSLESNFDAERVSTCNQETGNVFSTNLARFWKIKPEELEKKCFKITTAETGRTIKVTEDHPFYSSNGIIEAGKLKKGHKLIVRPIDTPLVEANEQIILSEKILVDHLLEKTYHKSLLKKLKEKKLTNLNMADAKTRIFARLTGHLFGDGTFILKGHQARAIFRGQVSDLENIREDIRELGFEPEKIVTRKYSGKIYNYKKTIEVVGSGSHFEVRNKPFCLILKILGAPNGDKVTQKTFVPEWIRKAPLFIKREFLAAYLGCELSTPTARKKIKTSFLTPTFKIAKIKDADANEFIEGIEKLLNDFKIRIASISKEKGNYRKDGTMSIINVIKLSATTTALKNLHGGIGFVYASFKDNIARAVFQYLTLKEKEIKKRKYLYKLTHALRKERITFKEISQKTGISVAMLGRWMHFNKETAGLSISFPSFEEWKEEATKGLGNSGLVWETIEQIEEIKMPFAFDITTKAGSHNFFANGFLTGNCKPYNADFDGDEMNMHVPQTQEGITEAKELMFVENQIISPRYGAPVIILDEDGVSGVFILTLASTQFSKDEAMKLFHMMGITDLPKPDRGKEYSGRLIFSQLLPKDLNLEYKTKTCRVVENLSIKDKEVQRRVDDHTVVKIKKGVLVTGVIDGESIGEGKGRLIDVLARDYPREVITRFYDTLGKISAEIVSTFGMTVSLDEYKTTPTVKKVTEKAIQEEIESSEELVKQYRKGTLEHIPGRTLEESFEIKMMDLGARVKEKVQKQIMEEKVTEMFGPMPKYNTITMILSGSRGSAVNLTNLSGLWGQAAVREGRPKRGFKDRLIALNQKKDVGVIAGGFISSNFMDGMSAFEYFYHAMGGRQGEVDTGVSTKVSGYLYRRLANALK